MVDERPWGAFGSPRIAHYALTCLPNPVSNLTTKKSNLDISLSPAVLCELMDVVDAVPPNVDGAMRELIQELIDNAKIFIARFKTIYFLKEEKIHEFIGLEFRDVDTSLVITQHRFRLILNQDSLGIFTTKEVPIDEMYDIRLVIAESQLPEFSEDTAKKDPSSPGS